MIVLPAIDLKDRKVVRLYKGDFTTVHQVADDPIETARAFAQAGASWMHMVDLDGAKSGARRNSDVVRAVAGDTGLHIELGGGMRTMEDLRAADDMGVRRMVIGSAAVTDPAFVREAVAAYGARIAVGIDTLDGMVKTAGWVEDSGREYLDFARSMEVIGVRVIVFTDIATDGALSGPSYDRLRALQAAVSCDIVASGGVTDLDDIKRLRDMGLYGAIIGKAYYAGTIDLAAAVKEAGVQC
ncbi:MAG: 1-(5-phosphoribosyl)-5-[(5-phosphoribosylamino)methylideneamino]imidazole-4-carboxamide isomerase [Oscillospiraceae bacterium]|nr:1-(5-phosphoribosyl)-5-[(5-phosphoribosylamino)methylideneamino]imidazole-4-carboxamide isomerase [Oscillospiraceae bacterium]